MKYLKSDTYREDLKTAVEHIVGFEMFSDKSVLVLGASGLIGSFLVDCLLYANEHFHSQIAIYAASRNIDQLRERFGRRQADDLHFIEMDVTEADFDQTFDYIIHAASYGHPKAFRETPVEVFLSNVIGMQKVLEMAMHNRRCRVLYVSSGEVQEQVDHLSARACYPMGKKAAETLCVSWNQEYGTDVVIARPCHTFGANMTRKDNRAASQFLMSAAGGANIVMYSAGEQLRSFSYVADCASGILTVLAKGECGAVYGVSSGTCCSVRMFADQCASAGNCEVKVHLPTDAQKAEASPIKNQIVRNDALKHLGWQPAFSIEEGIRRSIQILREMDGV